MTGLVFSLGIVGSALLGMYYLLEAIFGENKDDS